MFARPSHLSALFVLSVLYSWHFSLSFVSVMLICISSVRPSYDPQTLSLVTGYFSIYQFSAIYCNKAKYNLEMFGGQSYAKCADF